MDEKREGCEVAVRLGVEVAVESVASREFDVVVIKAGEANGYLYSPEVLKRGAYRFEGATVFLNHSDAITLTRPGGKDVGDVAGVVSAVEYFHEKVNGYQGRAGVRAVLSTTGPKGPMVAELAAQIVKDRAAGLPVPDIGLSADMFIKLAGDGKEVLDITKVVSLDVVFNPASGGSFERVLNSVKGQEGIMADDVKVIDEKVPAADAAGEVGAGLESVRATLASVEAARIAAEANTEAQLKLSCGALLSAALTSSTLPAPMKEEVRAQFADRVFPSDDLISALAAKETVYAQLVESSVIRGMGMHGPMVRGMHDSMDRIQAATNRLLGVPVDPELKDVPRLSGIRELYVMLTGDYDMHGVFHGERVQLANATTATMTSVVKNAMNVALLEAFTMRPMWWKPIAHEEDFATMDQITWMTLGGFGDLPTVDEGAAYTELEWADDENTADFVKKGGYIGITLEMIDRDRVSAVRAIPRKIGLGAWRTVSTLVSNLFTANSGIGPTLTDTGALFNATAQTTAGGHANLLTTAFSIAQWDVVMQAMYASTEQGSGKPQGIRPSFCLVPIELEGAALVAFGSPQLPGSPNNDINVRAMPMDRVITVPEWTDINNWAAVASPADCQSVCIGYRFGREPELFVADSALTGSMFTNDEMRIKARFVVAVGIGNYRGLHKSNVA